ncbi:RhoGAP domain containing protein [Tritrichomonas foetus]|uniref:RhoGAP domain containing protein n=1 Tax=Tritrichomonas foetus TaxID=1144522 RepID=A0A1J4KBG4_9EUKA|nr:RhoGAP domain containing protein [Tritrichomonas foetus]|eukprot:OHT07028.1 RhoGAP domain containing protein [Tritrichomonas foetus]
MNPQYFSRSPEQFGGKIPFVVSDLIEKLRELDAANVEGIFRLSGSARDISDLANMLDHGRVKDWSNFSNVHTISCTLKKYFRDMVTYDALLPYEYFQTAIDIPNKSANDDEAAAKFKELMNKLTPARRNTFAVLIKYLFEVSQSPTSKMHPQNLAIVFAPNLLTKQPGKIDPEEALLFNAQQNKAIATMIRLYEKIFDDINIGPELFVTDEDLEILASPPINARDLPRIIELRNLRKESLIPFVPGEMLADPAFVRPTRVVAVE